MNLTKRVNLKKMKKMLLAAAMISCFVATANATRYKVTITVQKTYVYYDENGKEVGRDSKPDTPQTITVNADTPYDAEQLALNECSTMCTMKGLGKDEGKMKYNGKYYDCRSYKEPWDVTNVVATN